MQRAEVAIPNPKSDTPKFPEEAIPNPKSDTPYLIFAPEPLNLAARSVGLQGPTGQHLSVTILSVLREVISSMMLCPRPASTQTLAGLLGDMFPESKNANVMVPTCLSPTLKSPQP